MYVAAKNFLYQAKKADVKHVSTQPSHMRLYVVMQS
jgi:hypothetical protein